MARGDDDDDAVDLGACCNCSARPATTILMLRRRAPLPATGWGCAICDLRPDGAISVLCDDCADGLAEAGGDPRFVCFGFPKDGRRIPFGDLAPDVFDHDPRKHMDC